MDHPAIQKHDYHQWANNRIFAHLKSLPQEVYNNKVQSVFSSIEEVIIHIYRVDGMWLSVMAGDTFEETMKVINTIQEESSGKNLQGMQALYENMATKYRAFLKKKDNLDEVIRITHPQYGSLETGISNLIQHVVNHGTYHRGNITAMLRQQGHAGTPTDFIFFIYELKK